ncbi:MAG: glycosyltransferase family 2 protein [Candidatus Omnitrophota bacterium]|nr:glycosyltransferase family 2 protein [Candidatus Omnitrophota bacterium]
MLCDIIIPVWNQLAFTKDCIDSIEKNTDTDHRLVIIDNGSGSDTSEYLKTLEGPSGLGALLIRNEENVGFVKAVNQGIAASSAPYVCLLNNDTIVAKDWLKVMIDIAARHKDIGIVNPSSNNLGQRPDKGEPIELYANKLAPEKEKFVELGSAIGFSMLIKRELVRRIGAFDEIYGMGNFEDTDFSRRAVKEGYRCVRACGAYVYHREGSSFSKLKTYEDDFRRNREIFEFRWGRPKRIAYILDRYDPNMLKRLELESIRLARGGNWVWYISNDMIDVPLHSNIRFAHIGGKWFPVKAALEIVKKKKKFDEIFVGSDRIGNILANLQFIHKAKVSWY